MEKQPNHLSVNSFKDSQITSKSETVELKNDDRPRSTTYTVSAGVDEIRPKSSTFDITGISSEFDIAQSKSDVHVTISEPVQTDPNTNESLRSDKNADERYSVKDSVEKPDSLSTGAFLQDVSTSKNYLIEPHRLDRLSDSSRTSIDEESTPPFPSDSDCSIDSTRVEVDSLGFDDDFIPSMIQDVRDSDLPESSEPNKNENKQVDQYVGKLFQYLQESKSMSTSQSEAEDDTARNSGVLKKPSRKDGKIDIRRVTVDDSSLRKHRDDSVDRNNMSDEDINLMELKNTLEKVNSDFFFSFYSICH